VPGQLQPRATGQQRLELRRDIAVLAGQVADLLLGEFDAGEVLGAADQQGIAEQHAVLGAAHRDDVGVANCFRGRNAQRGNCIGEGARRRRGRADRARVRGR
jgi:hypothetical protein